ncbi:MAG: hypothetical protein ACF8LK_07100 [Phycisphaerales bacterium JB041]
MLSRRAVAIVSIAGLSLAVNACGPSSPRQKAAVKAEVAAPPEATPMIEPPRPALSTADAPPRAVEVAPAAATRPAPPKPRAMKAPAPVRASTPPPSPRMSSAGVGIGSPGGSGGLSSAKQLSTARFNSGDREFVVEFGPDPVVGGDGANAVASEGGTGWKLSRGPGSRNFGFSYLSGFWQLFETDRTRTITWGGVNSGAGRVLPAGNGMPERDQIFIFCGGADVGPIDDSGGSKVKVPEGHYVTATTRDGRVVISDPAPFPTRGMPNPPADAASIIRFVEAMRAAHPDPCKQ